MSAMLLQRTRDRYGVCRVVGAIAAAHREAKVIFNVLAFGRRYIEDGVQCVMLLLLIRVVQSTRWRVCSSSR